MTVLCAVGIKPIDRSRRYDRSYGYDRGYKQEYRQGNCKIERKWERDGGYKEETKCKGYR